MTKSKGSQLNKARQQLIDTFLACLEEDKLPWKKGWKVVGTADNYNPISKTRYKGVNALLLMFVAYERGYDDPRWCTFKQAADQGWKVTKGSKGVPVEYWSVYDKTNKKNISLSEYNRELRKEDREADEFSIVSRTFTVFNAACIEGIPALEKKSVEKLNDIEMNDFIENIKNNMGVGYREVGNSAYYTPATDVVTMPPREQFKAQIEFDSTLLHELSHATGHESRLNREIRNPFGSENYAEEELRAEMSSVFLGQYMELDMGPESLNNHKAYIQSWAEKLKKDPNVLFRAIKDAEGIADYMIEKGEMEKFRETEMENEEVQESSSLEDKIAGAKEKVNCSGKDSKVCVENGQKKKNPICTPSI